MEKGNACDFVGGAGSGTQQSDTTAMERLANLVSQAHSVASRMEATANRAFPDFGEQKLSTGSLATAVPPLHLEWLINETSDLVRRLEVAADRFARII